MKLQSTLREHQVWKGTLGVMMGAGAAEVWMRIAVRVRSWRGHVGVNIKGRLFLFVFLT